MMNDTGTTLRRFFELVSTCRDIIDNKSTEFPSIMDMKCVIEKGKLFATSSTGQLHYIGKIQED